MLCSNEQGLYSSNQLLFQHKSLQDIEIPFIGKFLPSILDDDDDDLFASDQFRMYDFKVRKCTRSRSHDWTDCPFSHPGEKARRRDPRRYHYSGTVCPEFRRGSCSKSDNCEFAHGTFECWLHPTRYRTEACKDGKHCKRKVCFFAHTPRQLRHLLPSSPESPPSPLADERKFLNIGPVNNHCKCCRHCHHSNTASPNSTLLSMSHFTPPLSPSRSTFSPRSPYSPISRFCNFGGLSYKETLTDLMSSIEGLSVKEAQNQIVHSNTARSNLSWEDMNSFYGDDDQQRFTLSSPSSEIWVPDHFPGNGYTAEVNYNKANESGLSCPDFGWVNDLLT